MLQIDVPVFKCRLSVQNNNYNYEKTRRKEFIPLTPQHNARLQPCDDLKVHLKYLFTKPKTTHIAHPTSGVVCGVHIHVLSY